MMKRTKFQNHQKIEEIGGYGAFTTGEVARIVSESLIKGEQRTLYYKPFVNYFDDEEYEQFVIQLLKYGKRKLNLNRISTIIPKLIHQAEKEAAEIELRKLKQDEDKIKDRKLKLEKILKSKENE